ncbi:MAG: glutathione S-transferase family protein [Proteobacteria bacterium]|nr:glutathione S-transferase family protein [Pseudomonadota bacterium]MBS0574241.1 glutathione S-transferase family protein [Pseudomonadota bacterium]
MSLTLYFHPLASFCHKVLVALYENGTAFDPVIVDLGDATSRALLVAEWPLGKFPVLKDAERGLSLPESTIIIEHLDRHYPGPAPLLPGDAALALQVRLWDRVFDQHVHQPMQKIVLDRLRPEGQADAHGVAEARAQIEAAYDLLDRQLAGHGWAVGDRFSLADCAAAPALFYAGIVQPFGTRRRHLSAYFDRLAARPSVARTLAEARPYFPLFPYREAVPARFLADG